MQGSLGRITVVVSLVGAFGLSAQTPADGATRVASSVTARDPGVIPTTDTSYYYLNSVNSNPLRPGTFLDMATLTLTDQPADHLVRVDLVANQPITPTICHRPIPNVQWNISNPGCTLQIRLWAVNAQTGAMPTQQGANEYDFFLIPYAQPNGQVSQVGNMYGTYGARPQIVRQQVWGHHFITWISTRQFPSHRVHMTYLDVDTGVWVDSKHDAALVEDSAVGGGALPDLWIVP